MADLENGALVQHTTLGIGKVVAVETDAVHVFFPNSDGRVAAKLRLPGARAFLRTDGFDRDSWLEGLTAFSLDRKLGRYALAARWVTHAEALAQFVRAFPRGFPGDAYASGKGARAPRWRAAQAAWGEAFGGAAGARWLELGDSKVLTRRALAAERSAAQLHHAVDEQELKEALSREDKARPFWTALGEFLSVPSPGRARYEKIFAAARGLPAEPQVQWLVATQFPFLASPSRNVLVLPGLTFEAAERLGHDVGGDAAPTWATYSAVAALYRQLLDLLRPSGAKDFIDVECFLFVTATAKSRARGTR